MFVIAIFQLFFLYEFCASNTCKKHNDYEFCVSNICENNPNGEDRNIIIKTNDPEDYNFSPPIVYGDVLLENTNISNFSPIAQDLEYICGNLVIRYNAELLNICILEESPPFHCSTRKVFQDLEYIGGHLAIRNNEQLEDIDGFFNLYMVQGSINIFNTNLQKIRFPKLDSIYGNCRIDQNRALKELDLPYLQYTTNVIIKENLALILINVQMLNSVEKVEIVNNADDIKINANCYLYSTGSLKNGYCSSEEALQQLGPDQDIRDFEKVVEGYINNATTQDCNDFEDILISNFSFTDNDNVSYAEKILPQTNTILKECEELDSTSLLDYAQNIIYNLSSNLTTLVAQQALDIFSTAKNRINKTEQDAAADSARDILKRRSNLLKEFEKNLEGDDITIESDNITISVSHKKIEEGQKEQIYNIGDVNIQLNINDEGNFEDSCDTAFAVSDSESISLAAGIDSCAISDTSVQVSVDCPVSLGDGTIEGFDEREISGFEEMQCAYYDGETQKIINLGTTDDGSCKFSSTDQPNGGYYFVLFVPQPNILSWTEISDIQDFTLYPTGMATTLSLLFIASLLCFFGYKRDMRDRDPTLAKEKELHWMEKPVSLKTQSFSIVLLNSVRENHVWLTVCYRKYGSTYSSRERFAVLSLGVFVSTFMNAFFYSFDNTTEFETKIGKAAASCLIGVVIKSPARIAFQNSGYVGLRERLKSNENRVKYKDKPYKRIPLQMIAFIYTYTVIFISIVLTIAFGIKFERCTEEENPSMCFDNTDCDASWSETGAGGFVQTSAYSVILGILIIEPGVSFLIAVVTYFYNRFFASRHNKSSVRNLNTSLSKNSDSKEKSALKSGSKKNPDPESDSRKNSDPDSKKNSDPKSIELDKKGSEPKKKISATHIEHQCITQNQDDPSDMTNSNTKNITILMSGER